MSESVDGGTRSRETSVRPGGSRSVRAFCAAGRLEEVTVLFVIVVADLLSKGSHEGLSRHGERSRSQLLLKLLLKSAGTEIMLILAVNVLAVKVHLLIVPSPSSLLYSVRSVKKGLTLNIVSKSVFCTSSTCRIHFASARASPLQALLPQVDGTVRDVKDWTHKKVPCVVGARNVSSCPFLYRRPCQNPRAMFSP